MSKKKRDKGKSDKAQLPRKDAEVDLTEDDLSKVSGGVFQQNTGEDARVPGVRSGVTGFKVEIQK